MPNEYEKHRRPARGLEYKRRKADNQRSHPERNLLAQAKYRAKKEGLKFDLMVEDIKIPLLCPYLGIVLTQARGTGPRYASPTLDRIDNRKGYVRGNVEVISYRANILKRDLLPHEMMRMGRQLTKRGMQCF